MNKQLEQAMAVGRIKTALDGVMTALERGEKRGAADARALWLAIASEAQAQATAIPAATKARAPKAAKTAPGQVVINHSETAA